MPLIIELTPELESRLEQEASRQGIAPRDFARKLIEKGLMPDAAPAPTPDKESTWGARVLARWEREGLLGPFGDPNLDSPELARQLRRQAETREHEA